MRAIVWRWDSQGPYTTQQRSLSLNLCCVKGTWLAPPQEYLKRGTGLEGTRLSNISCSKAVDGQKGESGIFGKGTCRIFCRNWMTLDQQTVRIARSVVNCTSLAHNWCDGSNTIWDSTKRLDFLKKEKNATKQAAQKVLSSWLFRSRLRKKPSKISRIIGSFCFVTSPFTCFTPF